MLIFPDYLYVGRGGRGFLVAVIWDLFRGQGPALRKAQRFTYRTRDRANLGSKSRLVDCDYCSTFRRISCRIRID